MSRVVLKERQFEPTGNNLGDFSASDLESFDMQYTDTDMENDEQKSDSDDSNKSHVPDPLDDDKLNDNNKKSGNGGSSSGDSSGGNQNGQDSSDDKDSDEPEGVQDMPDTWDPYGKNLDEEDPDMPEEPKDNGDSDGSGGYSSPDDSDIPNQVPQSGQSGSDNNSGDGSEDGEEQNQNTSNSGSSDDISNDGGSDSSSSDTSLEDLLNDYQDSEGGSGDNQDGNSRGNSNSTLDGNGSPSSGRKQNSGNSSGGNQNGQDSSDGLEDHTPSPEELEAEDDDFNSSDSLSDLEQALDDIDSRSSSTSKQKDAADMEMAEREDDFNGSPRDKEDEIAAVKDLAGKAAKDMRSDKENVPLDSRYSDDIESEEDILQDLGLGNLTTVFNPGNLQDWRTRLDKIFDKALGFDIVTNPNLVNKKIEDAPPGREDDIPQIDNIAILLDMSGSMGAEKFKEVINHIDTMIRARKLNRVWFHIIGFGSSSLKDIEKYYTKVKGMKLKQTLMTKYKKDANWMTDFLPGVQYCVKKVPKPDGVIVMTDAEFNGSLQAYLSDSKVTLFMKRNKKRIIWALTSDASMSQVTAYDSSAVSGKRYIKFKKDGSRD